MAVPEVDSHLCSTTGANSWGDWWIARGHRCFSRATTTGVRCTGNDIPAGTPVANHKSSNVHTMCLNPSMQHFTSMNPQRTLVHDRQNKAMREIVAVARGSTFASAVLFKILSESIGMYSPA